MKTSPLSLSLLTLAAASFPLAAQTTSPAARPAAPHTAAAHRTSATAAAPGACSKLPELSPKIPALPAGLPCAKPLYTITTIPNVRLENVSPMEGPGLRETLGIEPSSFSLDYVDVKVGTGPLAAPHKWYTINYTGYLVDGTKFDSSLDRNEPISIPYGGHQVIPGWDTGFDGMHVGGKRRLFIPYQLAYGANGQRSIPAKAELIFDVELLSQSDEKPAPKTPPTPPATPAKPGDAKPSDAKPAPAGAPAASPTETVKPATPPPTQTTTPAPAATPKH